MKGFRGSRRGARARLAGAVVAIAGVAAVGIGAADGAPVPSVAQTRAATAAELSRLILLSGGAIDPTRSRGGAPAAFSLPGSRNTLWLVQLRGPVTRARLVRFASLHPREIGYLPVNTYVVRASAKQAGALAADRLDVRAAIPLQPYFKVRRASFAAVPGTPLRVIAWPDSPAATVRARLRTAGVRGVRVLSRVVLEVPARPGVLPRLAADPGVEMIAPVARMHVLNTDARWVTETAQRDNFFLSDPAGTTNSLGLAGQGLDGTGEAVGDADTGSSYYPDLNGTANAYFSDCTDPLHPTVATCKLADRTYEAKTAGDAHSGTYHQNQPFGLPGSGVHRKVETYFDLTGDGDPNLGGPTGKWHGDSGSSTHGSHTTGSVLGNRCDPCTPGSVTYPGGPYLANGAPSYDGVAPQARLVFQDVGNDGESLGGLPGDLYQLWDQSYDLGRDPTSDAADVSAGTSDDDTGKGTATAPEADHATSVFQRGITPRILSFSIGSFIPEVSLGNSPRTDDFDVSHEDYLQVVAAGNSGPNAATTGEPGTAKDVLTVGATANGRLDYASLDAMANFSSHGASSVAANTPSPQNEPFVLSAIKPDVSAPGLHNVSPKGGTNIEAQVLQGTSMATPTAAGDVTLIRQYLEDGFGPVKPGSGYAVGTRDVSGRGIAPGATHDGSGGVNPTAALVKGIAIASGERMRGRYTGTDGTNSAQDGQWPSAGQGWGRINLSSALHFGDIPGSPDLWIQDVPYGLGAPASPGGVAMGDDKTYKLTVADSSKPLKVILDWTDPGGTASFLGVGPEAIVNQLQVQVDSPDGKTKWCGNTINTMQPGNAGADVPSSTAGVCPGAGQDPDLANNVQGVYLPKPAPGVYTVHVLGTQVVQPQNQLGVGLPPCSPVDTSCRQGYALAATGSFSDPTIVHGGTPLVPSTPAISGVKVSTPRADVAVVHWHTASPSNSYAQVTGPDGYKQAVADVYSRPSFPGLNLVNIETQGPNFLNVPVYGTEHEVKLTGLSRGTDYSLSVGAANAAGFAGTPSPIRFTTPSDVFGIQNAGDTANFFEYTNSDANAPVPISDPQGADPWGTSSQLYVGQTPTTAGNLQPGAPSQVAPVVGAFKFTLPKGVDLGTVTGAAVLLTTRQDITSRVLDLPHHQLDLLDPSVDSTWGPGTPHSTVDNAPAAARLAPADSSLRDVPFQTEALAFSCAGLTKLLGNLKDNAQAAFRATGTAATDDSLYAWESGFARRASGLEQGPRLVLFRGGGDPTGASTSTSAPQISDVRVERAGTDNAVVYWKTDVPSNSLVLFRTAGTSGAPIQVGSPAYATDHEVGLTSLGGAALEFAVRSAVDSGASSTDSGGPGQAYQLPATVKATPPRAPAAATATSTADFSVPTETVTDAQNTSHGDGLICRKATVTGVTPSVPGAPSGGGKGKGKGKGQRPSASHKGVPYLSRLTIKPYAFVALPRGGPVTGARSGGAVVGYRDSLSAYTTLQVLRSRPGVVSRGRCVPLPRHPARHGKKPRTCVRLQYIGSFAHQDRAGNVRLRFTGRVGGRALAPGTYVMRIQARLRGKASISRGRSFRILAPRRAGPRAGGRR